MSIKRFGTRLAPWLAACALSVSFSAVAADQDGDGIDDAVETAVGLDPATANVGVLFLNDNTDFGRDRPRVALDSEGNYHVAFRRGSPDDEFDSGTADPMEVAYMMLSADGEVLVDETALADVGTGGLRGVNLAVTSDDKVIVVWAPRGTSIPTFIRLDPSADDQSGDAATLGTITEVAAVALGATTMSGQTTMAIDAADAIHLWSNDGRYLKADADGNVLTPVVIYASVDKNGHTPNMMTLDADGNVHVIFQDSVTTNNSVSYMMLNGADGTGTVLIDRTPIVTAVEDPLAPGTPLPPHSSHYSIFTAPDGQIYLVWGDKRDTPDEFSYCDFCGSGGTMWLAKVDPSLDDQNGDAADMTVIKTMDDVALPAAWYSRANIDSTGVIHLFWQYGTSGLGHVAVDGTGDVVSPAGLFDLNANDHGGWNQHMISYMAGDNVFYPQTGAVNNSGTRLVSRALVLPASGDASAKVIGGRPGYFEAFAESGLPDDAMDGFPTDDFVATGNFYRFVIEGVVPGGSASVTIDTGADLPADFSIIKFDGSEWFEIGASKVNDTSFAVTLVDGGLGDADGEANGMIVDPLALATPVATVPVNVSGGGGGGCVIGDGNRPMDPLFPALLALAAAYFIRRRMTN